MSVKKLIATRNFFINTDDARNGDGRSARYNLPQGLMMCNENQTMRVTLNSFNMRQGWYRINRYNNVFYVAGITSADPPVIGSVRIVLDEGDYHAFDSNLGLGIMPSAAELSTLSRTSLKHQIWYQLTQATQPTPPLFVNGISDINVVFDSLTKIYSITLAAEFTVAPPAPNYTELKMVSFYITDYNAAEASDVITEIVGDRSADVFQNNFEIVGGCAEIRNVIPGTTKAERFTQLYQLYTGTSAAPYINYTFIGDFKATLQSEECIYIRTNLQSSNFQTTGFDTGGAKVPEIQPSQILAKIPLNNPVFAVTDTTTTVSAGTTDLGQTTYQRPYEFLNFTDNGNNIYSLMLDAKKVSFFEIRLTDSYGRPIPEASIEQLRCKALSFSCDLRVDVFQEVPLRVVPMNVGVGQ
mgnify:CR=1 FL=1